MFSTALSAGLIPFWFSVLSRTWTREYIVIGPPSDIGLAELEIFIPTALGLLYKRAYGKKKARLMAKVINTERYHFLGCKFFTHSLHIHANVFSQILSLS